MPAIDRTPGSPPATQQIATYYRALITHGDLPAGARLPTAAELAREWDVSSVTVRASLDVLRSEGLIRSRQGQGVFVRPPVKRARRDAANNQILKDNVLLPESERRMTGSAERDLGISLDQLDFQAEYEIVTPAEDVAQILNLSPGDKVLQKRYSTRFRDSGLLAQDSVEWVPVDIIKPNPKLLDQDEEPWPGGGMHQLYTVGVEIDRVEDLVTASMPTPVEQSSWGLDVGVPMLRTRCVSFSVDSVPVTVSDAAYPSDRTELAFTTRLVRWAHSATKGQS